MTDKFEQALQRILREANADNGVTPSHLLDALIATNEDLDLQHEQTEAWHQEVIARLDIHCAEAAVRDEDIAALQDWRRHTAEHCEARILEIIQPHLEKKTHEHREFHEEYVAGLLQPRRKDDPPHSDYEDERKVVVERSLSQMVLGWTLFKKALAIAVTALIIGGVGIGVSYVGGYIAATRAEDAAIHYEATASPTPVPTITITVEPSL